MAIADTQAVNTGVPGSNYGVFSGPQQAGNPNSHIIDRRHAEWRTHQLRWRWLGDTWEGGEAYRQAIYGWDLTGLPVRNLIRHKREYPDPREQNYYGVLGRPPGSDMAAQATNDDYELRRARTPVPTLFRRVIRRHLSKIYSQTPKRNGPAELLQWHTDVDGGRTSMAKWMRNTVAPLLMSRGQIDIICEHPYATKDQKAHILTKADEYAAGLNAVVASYILSENVVWWSLDARGLYHEVLVQEPQEEKGPSYRFWQPEKWTLFNVQGDILDTADHPYGRPPITRLFDTRRFTAKNIGFPRYEDVAEINREVYNRESELVLSDATQAHPLLQGPEDFMQASDSIPVGIGWMLPMKKTISDTSVSYQGFEIIEFPKGSAESLRDNVRTLKDDVDECALLTKPAGGAGTNGKTVAQSGVSKRMDTEDGNTYLSEIAEVLECAEIQINELFYLVRNNGKVDPAVLDQIKVCYAKDFDLFGPDELAGLMTDWQTLLAGVGGTPAVDVAQLKRLLRLIMLGAPSEEFLAWDQEIEAYVQAAAVLRGQVNELPAIPHFQATSPVGANVPGTESQPDSINAASLASAGVLVNEVY
jgi:hypothetical protein